MGGAYFTHNHANLFYTIEGSGDPVVLIHGWACDQSDWIFQVPFLLTHGFQVIALDQRGHGRSAAPLPATSDDLGACLYDPETLTDDVAALLKHLGIGTGNGRGKAAIVMGHSLGGVVAAELAFRYPNMVRALVLVDAAYYHSAAQGEQIVEILKKALEAAPEIAAAMFEQGDMDSAETPAWLKAWRRRRTWAVPAYVITAVFEQLTAFLGQWGTAVEYMKGRIDAPKLVTCADQKKADVERAIGLNEEVDSVGVIAAGHWFHQVEAERFNSVVERWFNERGFLSTSSG
ncbi:Alpha/Beta hydrolase protein [Macrophomina phaseolina]|uniref:Alpha/Beta hydrolase protein n=1 Tax=Macrophomina phaseolina TaxID=35725 RepID=A0ABQ8FQI2_9PEZI|nr:Alpha/Beta hydrolase protein [Macrophomina phaseolina]